MKCPKCESEKIVKNGKVTLKDNSSIQKYRCRGCTQRADRDTDGKVENTNNDDIDGNQGQHRRNGSKANSKSTGQISRNNNQMGIEIVI